MLGGLGPCGNSACCTIFLGDFDPVSIKMAKEQGLSLNPTKISGLCGRLMCCLKYEHETYEELIEKLPTVGTVAMTPLGKGTIIEVYTLLETVKVKVRLEDDTEDVFTYKVDEIEITEEKDSQYFKGDEYDKEEVNGHEEKKCHGKCQNNCPVKEAMHNEEVKDKELETDNPIEDRKKCDK